MHAAGRTDRPHMNASVNAFFALTFLLSVPFYVLNALAHLGVFGNPGIEAIYVACFTVTPIAAASILTFRRSGARGLKRLLRRIFDFQRISERRWYAAILLLPPLIFLVALGMLAMSGAPLPPALTPLVALPLVLMFFFLLAAGEEVGWMGCAFEPMQARVGALRAALVTMPEILAVTPWGPALLSGLFGVAAVLVVAMWGPRTLAKYRFADRASPAG